MAPAMTSTEVNRDAVDFRKVPNNTHKNWWNDTALRWNMLHCIGLCGTLFFNGYDGSLFNGLQSINQWQEYFGHPDANTLGLMNSSGFLPGIIASFSGDRFAHYFGRRPTVWVGTCICAVGCLIMAIATSVGMFCGGRVIQGFGTSFALTVAPSLLQEIAHPRYRAPLSGFYTCIYYIAATISSSVCIGTFNMTGNKAWRIPCFIQLVGPAFTLIVTATMPESPRWLVKKGKAQEARRTLIKYHANGKDDDELANYEYRQIVQALEDEKNHSQQSYANFFKTKGNIRRLAINIIVAVGTNWVGNGIVSYYLSPILKTLGITEAATQLKILIGLAVWNLLVSTTAALLIDRAGRRPLWLVSTAVMLASFVVVMGLSASYDSSRKKAVGAAAIPFLFIFYGGYDIAWTPLAYSYPVEILPFSLRTKGQAIFIAVQTLAVSVNTWVNPVALTAIAWKYYAVYIAVLAFLLVVIYFYFPETKGLTIEEIAIVFDKDQAAGVVQAAYEDDGKKKDAGDVERIEDMGVTGDKAVNV